MDYADTSFLLSWHLADARFPRALKLLPARGGIAWSPWQQVEFNNAARALVFRRVIDQADLAAAQRSIAAAVACRDLVPSDLPSAELWLRAETISREHTQQLGTRTLDLLHVAAAGVLRCRRFLTFDERQATLATACGFTVLGLQPTP